MTVNLSIIIVGRNDNHRGNFNSNLQQWIWNTHTLLPNAEIILVDWNQLSNEKPLAKAVSWPNNIDAKVIIVPAQVHNSIINPLGVPLLEYWAKNVGIRRASGRFILSTNTDTLLSDYLAEEISQDLDNDTWWRANRIDVEPDIPTDMRLPWPEFHQLTINGQWGSYKYNSFDIKGYTTAALRRVRRHWIYRCWKVPHENGAGDFLLAPKLIWELVGGWPQLDIQTHSDAIMTCQMHKVTPGKIFLGPLYHRGQRTTYPRDPWADKVKATIMRGASSLLPFNLNWGLDNIDLPMERISVR